MPNLFNIVRDYKKEMDEDWIYMTDKERDVTKRICDELYYQLECLCGHHSGHFENYDRMLVREALRFLPESDKNDL